MKKTNNSIATTAIICGVVLAMFLILFFSFKSSVSSGNTVNVQGYATIDAMPDLVTVYFSVETKADTATEAKNNNSEIMENVLTALMLEGFDRDEIVTENFNVYPNYIWDDKGRTEDGYIATHSVKVEMSADKFDKVGNVVDAGVDAGANINYINFELSVEKQNEYKAEAMKLAAQDARIKAESVAQGFGKNVGKLVSISVSEFGYYPWNVFSARGGMEDVALAKEAATSIQPGEREISATVSAVYKIK